MDRKIQNDSRELYGSIFLDRSDIIKQGFGKRKHIITQHLLISLRFGLLPLASSSLKFSLIVQIFVDFPNLLTEFYYWKGLVIANLGLCYFVNKKFAKIFSSHGKKCGKYDKIY